MEEDRNWDVINVDQIAEVFDIPQLQDIIDYNNKVSINMDHASGWVEEDGEKFHVMPVVDFHPMDNDSGFELVHYHAQLDEDGQTKATVYSFEKSDTGYRVRLDDEEQIAEKEITVDGDEYEDLEEFPASSNENPFKTLGEIPAMD